MAIKHAAYKYQDRRFTVQAIGNAYMVQEFYQCAESPSGYYTDGPPRFFDRTTEAVSPEQAVAIFCQPRDGISETHGTLRGEAVGEG